MATKRSQRAYDHRLVLLVQETRDPSIATRLGVPRSTVAGWTRRAPRVVTAASASDEAAVLLRRVARLERRCRRLVAILHVVFALLRAVKADLSRLRVAALDKARLLRAVDRTRGVLGLRRVFSSIGLSPSRLSAWRRAARACEPPPPPAACRELERNVHNVVTRSSAEPPAGSATTRCHPCRARRSGRTF